MTLNTGYYLQAYTFITLILCGLVQYFTGMQSVLWIPFFLTLLMVGLMVMQTRESPLHLDAQETIILALYFSFLLLAGASTLLQGGVTVAIVAFKNEIALSLVMICLLLGFCRESQIYRATRYLYWVFYAQVPVMIYQVLLVVPQRVAQRGEEEKWDSVVGTFGGDPMGGGNTAAMGLFCLLIMLLKLSEYKHGLTTFKSMALHIILGFGLCIIGEVKFVILLSPLFIPHFTIGLGMLMLVSQLNLGRGYPLVIFCHIVLVLPFVLRSVYVSLKNLEQRIELAAASLGASPLRVVWTITVPLILPGLFGGWLFAAILSFNEFTASLFITTQATQTLPVAMYNYVREFADPTLAALSVIYIVVTATMLIIANKFLGLGKVLNVEARH